MGQLTPESTNETFPPPTSLYVHVPFCRHRCGYCNFALVADRDYLIDGFLDALELEMELANASGAIDTLFIGGGTPTHLNEKQTRRLFESVFRRFELNDEFEMSVEANPSDICSDKVHLLKSLGVNRISLGAQSFRETKLRQLERDHSPERIVRAVEICRETLDSISLDLIFGVASETLEQWRADLHSALGCRVDHLSTYELTIEKGTQFWNRERQNQSMSVEQETNAELYKETMEYLDDAGLNQYEVSSFARPGHRCRHNQSYWNGNRYFAFGPAAASFVGNQRQTNHASLARYMRELQQRRLPIAESETLSDQEIAVDMITFGLRMNEGCDLERLRSVSGLAIEDLNLTSLDTLVKNGLLVQDSRSLRLTDRGWMLADSVCQTIFTERGKLA